jgi:hypothetical protein
VENQTYLRLSRLWWCSAFFLRFKDALGEVRVSQSRNGTKKCAHEKVWVMAGCTQVVRKIGGEQKTGLTSLIRSICRLEMTLDSDGRSGGEVEEV